MATQPTPGSWTLDAASSRVGLHHKTIWGLVTVKGVFGAVQGAGEIGADGSATGRVLVDAASIDTKHGKRDKHLRSKDFFEVETHPQIVFEAATVRPTSDGAVVEGELTVRGISRKIDFPVRVETEGADAVVLTGKVEIDRADFGMTWNQLGMLKGPATIDLALRFTPTAATA
ncbi:YceI family protein [Actinospica durhamensis]|uniref:YceI family protein n=1 Tax=Actinospica durhamensis TaxID=1508375 RepID=A0A941F0I3_9ACTN|nr:YceI family protein [Actinospica durhamensis]MBR7838084.1 YceI family protein [Actinospica durhamensis]